MMKDLEDNNAARPPEVEKPPGLLKGLPSKGRDRAGRAFAYATRHWARSLVCVMAFLVAALLADLTAAFFIAFALVMLLMGLDGRISIALFVICLAVCPLMLAIGDTGWAKESAIWAYYFLAIGVITLLVAFWKVRWAENRLSGGTAEQTSDPAQLRESSQSGPIGKVISYVRENMVSAIGYMIIATFAANFLNYLFNVSAGRLLGRDVYGEFAALLTIFMILTVPTNSLQAMLAKKVAEFRMAGSEGDIREITLQCLRICLFAAVLVVLIFLAIGRPVANYLHIDEVTPVIICGIAIASTLLLPVFYGVMQGYLWFIWLGNIFFAYAAGRFVFGWLFIKVGWGLSGALLGGAVSSVLVIAVSAYAIRRVFTRERTENRFRLREIGRSYLPFIIANGIFFLLVSVDTIIVKRKFSASIAGDYACAAFLGRIILYFPSSVGIVIFPKMVESHVSGQDTRSILRKGILIVLAGSLALAAVFIAFPSFTITKLYGEEFVGATSILWIISLSMTICTVVGLLIYYFLATEETRFLIVSLTACTAGGLAAMYFIAASSFQVALAQFLAGGAFAILALLRIARMGTGRAGTARTEEPVRPDV
jgi:O-antigen/teichoic acid export membrane protein